ncbi:MAG TPA: DUF4199 domain-containing protein [Prevotella sp.]|nr:DUF4199 domain-containing protein [Candidatus Segatella violae]
MSQENKKKKKVVITIDIGKIMQTKAFARQDGAILGAIWILSFACTMLATDPKNQLLGLVSNVLIICTPFVVAKRLKSFRDYALEGKISFKRGLYYCLQTFFYATLLLTIVQYLWFRFMDVSPFMNALQSNYQVVMQAYQMTTEQAHTVLEAITMMKPIAWASMFMVVDLIVGVVLSPIIALTMARNNKVLRQDINKQQK